jgi:adenine-specific DNA-methyltransferase
MGNKTRLELTWIGKENRPRLEPRILLEDGEKSYHAQKWVSEKDIFDNRLIFGDNLLALKALEQEFAGKIKCIYIDPPYNTGSAFKHYDDSLEHSIWLSLMRDRIELLRGLLATDGIILCSIDTAELYHAGILFDENFGRANRIELFVWKKSYGGGAKSRYVVNQSEFILCYAKDIEKLPPLFLPPDEKVMKYYKYKDEHYEKRGPYRLQPLATTSNDERPNLRYPIKYTEKDIWPEKQWQWSEDRVTKAIAANGIVFTERNNKVTVSYKQYLRDEEGEERQTKPTSIIDGFYTQHGTYESVALFGQDNKFQFPKPEGLLRHLLEMTTFPGDWVLDSFGGSGTSGVVAHKMGRRWIMVELGEHCHTHIIPRMKKVIDGEDPGGITKAVDWKGGGGFRYYRLAPSLLEKDKWNNWVISKDYDATMLASAMAKHEGFVYNPDETLYWKQGKSTEKDYIFTTTNFITIEYLDSIHEEMLPDESLLICCKSFQEACEDRYASITVKKIPNMLLGRCEFGKEDYSLNIANELQPDMETVDEQEQTANKKGKASKKKGPANQPTLFDKEGE